MNLFIFNSTKLGYTAHDAKVNKWLAEQNAALADQALSMDYRRSRTQRAEPSPAQSFNWKNWTGEENVPVINKLTGKRLTGNKAPQLKRLIQW